MISDYFKTRGTISLVHSRYESSIPYYETSPADMTVDG
jgi:hypothetical protein